MLKPFVLTPDLVNFCQGDVDIIVASCERDGWPIVGLALASRVDAKTQTVKLILQQKPNAPLLHAITQGKGIAATYSQPSTHRSIQLKGPAARIAPVSAEDRQHAIDQCAAFSRGMAGIGFPEVFCLTFCAHDADDLTALIFTPTEAFVQTPGPDAGNVLQQ